MLTELQICEAISAWFEPKPTTPATILDSSVLSLTPKGAWKFNFPDWEWRSLNYYHDEAANARLLESMRAKFPYVAIEFYKGITFELSGIEGGWSAKFATNDFMAATVYAFLKFAGIEVEHVD